MAAALWMTRSGTSAPSGVPFSAHFMHEDLQQPGVMSTAAPERLFENAKMTSSK